MLFVGVTILLASTYVTMVTQEKLVQQDSVVKLAKPIDVQHLDNHKQLDGQQLTTCYMTTIFNVMRFVIVISCLHYLSNVASKWLTL